MPLLPVATQLSHPEKDALIAALTARLVLADQRIAVQAAHIAAQDARIAALELRLNQLTRPPKTPSNSSKPPSQGQKQDLPASATDRPPRKSRPGVGRTLHPNPDRTIERLLTTCPKCQAVFPDVSQTPQQVYERIELPPVRPDVTQIRLFGGRCACCGERVTAEAPAGLEQGSPFGPSIAAMVVYLHYAQAIGMERLALLMNELFSLSISEGAISNILARAREPLLDATATIEKVVLASPVVCSDETSVRVKGKNWWEWVFIGTLAVLHTIQPSRGKAVVTALFGDIRPEVWVSDLRRPQMEEIGDRTTVFEFGGLRDRQRDYIDWVLKISLEEGVTPEDIMTDAAATRLAAKLKTPLQIGQHLVRAFEAGFEVGAKPVDEAVVEAVLSLRIDDLEPRLTRSGYDVRSLAEQFDAKPAEIRRLLRGDLDPARSRELMDEMRAAGLPT